MLMNRAAGLAVALVLAAAPVALADTAPPTVPAPVPSFSHQPGPTLAPTESPTASSSPSPTKSELAETGAREDQISWLGFAAGLVLLTGIGMTGTGLYWYSNGKMRRPAWQRRTH
jgi:cell division septation protein DedD